MALPGHPTLSAFFGSTAVHAPLSRSNRTGVNHQAEPGRSAPRSWWPGRSPPRNLAALRSVGLQSHSRAWDHNALGVSAVVMSLLGRARIRTDSILGLLVRCQSPSGGTTWT